MNEKLFKYGILAFYLSIPLEGIFRKWITPGLATPLFFVKYAVILGVCILFILTHKKLLDRHIHFPYPLLLFFLFICLCGFVNTVLLFGPRNGTIVGVIGLMIHLAFIPLLTFIPRLIRRQERFEKMLFVFSIICIGIFILGVIQYLSPPTSFINRYAAEDAENIATVNGAARITTVFSYIGGNAKFTSFATLLLFSFLLNLKNKKYLFFVLAAFGLGMVNLLMTGSRGAVGISLICIFLFFIAYLIFVSPAALYRLAPKLLLVSLVGMILVFRSDFGSSALDNFIARAESSDKIEDRVGNNFAFFQYAGRAGLIGYGIGTAYQGNARFIDGNNKPNMPRWFEPEGERLVVELGVLGFLVIIALRIAILIFGIRVFFAVKDKMLRALVLMMIIHMSPAIISFGMYVYNWVGNVIFWTEAALFIAIYQIGIRQQADQETKMKRKAVLS